jgi:type I restriction enzyme S subunit
MKSKKYFLTDICDFEGGSQPPKNEWSKNKREGYIRMLQIRDFTQKKEKYIEFIKENNRTKKCIENDVLIGRYGASVGKILTGLSGAYNVAMMKTIPNEKLITKKYLFYLLKSTDFQNFITKIAVRAAQAGFNKNDLSSFSVSLPDIHNQLKITKVLEEVESIITYRMESLSLLDELVKSSFLEKFGDPISNPKRISQVSLGSLGIWRSGATPLRSRQDYFKGDVPWITSGELNSLFISDSKEHITSEAVMNSSVSLIESGSLLLGMYDTAALKSSITEEEMTCNQAIAHAKLNDAKCNTIFIYYLIQVGKSFFKKQRRGVRQKNMNLSMIKSIKVLSPKIELQNEFAGIVQKVQKIKLNFHKSLNELEHLNGSISQKAFKGELDLSKLNIDNLMPNDGMDFNTFEEQSIPEPKKSKPIKIAAKKKAVSKPKVEAKSVGNKPLDGIPEELLGKLGVAERINEVEGFVEEFIDQTSHPKKTKEKVISLVREGVAFAVFVKWLKDEFKTNHFTMEMLMRALKSDRIPYSYATSKELKENRKYDSSQDIKEIVFKSLKNDFDELILEQVFYNGEKENFTLKVRKNDYDLIKDKSKKERSGIYLKVK